MKIAEKDGVLFLVILLYFSYPIIPFQVTVQLLFEPLYLESHLSVDQLTFEHGLHVRIGGFRQFDGQRCENLKTATLQSKWCNELLCYDYN